MKDKIYVKITNCSVKIGGGQKAVRYRHNQNATVPLSKETLERPDEYILQRINSYTEGKIMPTSSSKIIRKDA